MRITRVLERPVASFPYRVAGGRLGRKSPQLHLYVAETEGLPPSLGGLFACSDLQGVAMDPPRRGQLPRLLGHELAAKLQRVTGRGRIPHRRDLGVLLAGDLYAHRDLGGMGGLGDVSHVWRAFRKKTRWVAGVAGNHDQLGVEEDLSDPAIHLLDGQVVVRDGLRIGGVCGVVGNRRQRFQYTLEGFLAAVEGVLRERPDVLVLHLGPPSAAGSGRGPAELRAVLGEHPDLLVIFGHDARKSPLEQIPGGAQLCNVHGRVLVLVPPREGAKP